MCKAKEKKQIPIDSMIDQNAKGSTKSGIRFFSSKLLSLIGVREFSRALCTIAHRS